MLPLGSVPMVFSMALTRAVSMSAIIVGSSLIAFDIALIVLSLTIWWNVPLAVGPDGIAKKGETFRWDDATSIIMKTILRLHFGTIDAIRITYSNGRSIQFETTDPIGKDILAACKDERFLTLLKESGYEYDP